MNNTLTSIITIVLALFASTAQAQTVIAKFSVSAQTPICQNTAVVFNNMTTTTGNPSNLVYQWNFGYTAGPSTSNWNLHTPPTITFYGSGAPQIQLMVFDTVNNIYSYFDTTLTIWPSPYINMVTPYNPTLTCITDSITMTATGTSGSTIAWHVGTPSSSVFAGTGNTFVTRTDGDHFALAYSSQGCKSSPYTFSVGKILPQTVDIGYWGTIALISADSVSFCSNALSQLFGSVQGGTYPIQYTWTGARNGTFQGMVPDVTGTYVLTVKDYYDCIASDTIYVSLNEPPKDSVVISNANPCVGDTVTISALPGYDTYAWNTGQKTDTIEVFSDSWLVVNLTDTNGCITTSSVYPIVYTPLPEPEIKANGCYLAVSKITTGSTYQWYFEGNPVPGATTQFITATKKGYYAVEETNATGCSALSLVEFADCTPAGIPRSTVSTLKVYPNPFVDMFGIETKEGSQYTMTLRTISGSMVLERSITKNDKVDARNIPNGVYILTLSNENERIVERIVKK